MLTGILGILAFVFVLGLIILIHEAGHFFFARRAGVLCHEFSFGMGPVLWQTKRGETVYSIRAIPIGGYVMMAGEDENTSMVQKNQEVRLVVENNIVTKIVVDLNNKEYSNLEIVKVVDIDLYGKDGDLFVVVEDEGETSRYTVKRNGVYVFRKNEMYFSPYERSMESKTKWQRFLAIFGGPMMNFILAIVAFFIVGAFTGAPQMDSTTMGQVVEDGPAYNTGLRAGDTLVSINGVTVDSWEDISTELDKSIVGDVDLVWTRDGETLEGTVSPRIIFYSAGFSSSSTSEGLVVTGVSDDTIAGKAGMESGDEILSIDGVSVNTWDQVVDIIGANTAGNEMTFEVNSNGEVETITILLFDEELVNAQGFAIIDSQIGIGAEYKFDLGYAVQYGFVGTWGSVEMIVDTIQLLFSSDRVGVGDLAGPVGIYSMTSRIAQAGFISLISWLGLLSVNVGVLNILPIPALDGGRLVFLGFEAVTGRKVNRNIENRIHTMMYFALLALFAIVTWNDILRLIGIK